jgi:hypothetical protein
MDAPDVPHDVFAPADQGLAELLDEYALTRDDWEARR